MGFGFRVSRLGDGKAQLDRLGAHPQAAREQLGALPLRLATMASSSAERAACVSEPCCRRAVPRGRGRARAAQHHERRDGRHAPTAPLAALAHERDVRQSTDPRSSEVSRGHQRSSEAIRGHQSIPGQVGGERRVAVARLVIMVAEVLVTVGKAVVRAAVVAALHNVDREPPSAPCGTSFRLTASATASANPAPRTAVAPPCVAASADAHAVSMLEHGLCRPSTNESRYVVARHLVHRGPRRRRLCDREVGRSMPWNTPLLLPTHARTHACSYPYPSPSKRPLLRIHRTHLGHRDPKQPACQSAPPADEAAELHALQLHLAQRGELMLIGHKLGNTHHADGPRCRSRRRELSFVSITTSL
jgi:hypothetical protein